MHRILEKLLPAAAFAAVLLATPASAQVASALIRQGDALSGAPAGHVVTTGLLEISGNTNGGFGVNLSSSDGTTTLSHVWGSSDGTAPTVLRTEGTHDNIMQTSFETFFGISNQGEVSYSPLGTDLLTGTTSVDCVFVDDLAVCKEGYPIPSLPGKVFRFGSRPDITSDGHPYWGGGINDMSGTNEGYGLFFGSGATLLFKTGDTLPGMNGPVGSGIDFDYRFSALGTHWISHVASTAGTTMDGHVILDGSVLTIGGTPTVEGQIVPVSAGGIGGEAWAFFDYFGISETGDYMITGDTSGPTTTDEFLLKNGVILYREGDVIDGETVIGSIEDARMDEAGNVAYVWAITSPSGNLQAAFWNDQLIIKQGDLVDLDGDGVVEPTSIVVDLDTLWTASNGKLYLTADIDVNGTSSTTDDIQAFFELDAPCPSPSVYCTAKVTSGGCVPAIGFTGTPIPGGGFTVTCDQVEPGRMGLLFYSTTGNFGGGFPFQGGFLCASPPQMRTPVQDSGGSLACSGTFSTSLDALVSSLAAGTQVWSQYWFRDPASPSTTGLSDALTFIVCP
ncbi:MAG TPA: hypothetical protein VMS76_16305 [Planctomycetota bacterium]|nr:hypothetical protein [Planctomycetota bacterium]